MPPVMVCAHPLGSVHLSAFAPVGVGGAGTSPPAAGGMAGAAPAVREMPDSPFATVACVISSRRQASASTAAVTRSGSFEAAARVIQVFLIVSAGSARVDPEVNGVAAGAIPRSPDPRGRRAAAGEVPLLH